MKNAIDLWREMQNTARNEARALASSPLDDDPAHTYERFLAAVAGRRVDDALAALSESYGSQLRASRCKQRFPALFELWCAAFPENWRIKASFVDGDTATLETEVELDLDGAVVAGHVTLVHDGNAWRVDAERCCDGRTRIPLASFQSFESETLPSPRVSYG